MKRPGLFRTPKHQRFNLSPRHYDPIREELDAREARIRAEVEQEKKGIKPDSDDLVYSSGGLRGAFKHRSNRTKTKAINGTQLVVMILLISALAAFWFYGNNGLYIVLLVGSLLLFLRLRRYI